MPELSSPNRHVDEKYNWTRERRRKAPTTHREPAPTTHRKTRCFCIVRKGSGNKSNYKIKKKATRQRIQKKKKKAKKKKNMKKKKRKKKKKKKKKKKRNKFVLCFKINIF